MWCFLDFAAMRVFKSLLWGLCAFFLTVYVGLATAQTVVPEKYYSASSSFVGPGFALDSEAACVRSLSVKNTSPAYAHVKLEGTSCKGFRSGMPVGSTATYATSSLLSCPSTRPYFDDSIPGCVAVKVPPETCLPSDTITRNTYVVTKAGKDIYDPFAAVPGAQNGMGCKVEVIDIVDCYSLPKSADPGTIYCTFTTKQTGGTANPSPSPVTPGEEEKTRENSPPVTGKDDGTCPKGSVNVGLSASGIPMCIGQGTTPANSPPAPPKIETEKNEPTSDGGTKNTKTETVTNADGSKTTTTTVTVTGPTGEKSTTQEKTTGTNSGGGAGRETKPDDKSDLCKQNPLLNVCKNSTVAGKCAEIACTGDAVQCATLRAAAAMECRGKADEDALKASPQTALGNSILSGSDPMKAKIEETMKGTEIDLSKPGLDETGFIGGGSCLPNKTMTVMGRSVTVEFAQLCTNIQPLRGVVMACAFILAYMIVSRSVLQG